MALYYRRPMRPKRPIRRRRAVGRRTTFKKPARFNFSMPRYKKNRAIASKMSKYSETKLNPCREVNEDPPSAIQIGASAYYQAYVIGDLPSSWDSGIFPLNGMSTTFGTEGVAQRVGNYVYLKKTHFLLEIDMKAALDTLAASPLTEFRVVVCKTRQAIVASGQVKVPQRDLFLKLDGSPYSYQTSGIDGTDLIRQPLNKRDWVIHSDKKFMLTSPPTLRDSGGLQPTTYNQKYRSAARMTFNLPYYKRVRYAVSDTASYPTDIDYHWGVFIFARAVNKDSPASNWECNVRAVTSYTDS